MMKPDVTWLQHVEIQCWKVQILMKILIMGIPNITFFLNSLTGKKMFKLGVTVHNNLEALAINGIDLRTRLLTRHTEQVITAPYYFVSMDVRAALHILGLYNNQNLTSLTSLGLSSKDVFQGLRGLFI